MDAAESHLEGDVSPRTAIGAIRYRLWPAKRHPIRFGVASLVVLAASTAAWFAYESPVWVLLVFFGLTLAVSLLLFPTEVALDGPTLHVRSLGTPRTWDLREFQRLEVCSEIIPRVELGTRATLTPADSVSGVTLPLPADERVASSVVAHLKQWVGRSPLDSHEHELRADLAPEDRVAEERVASG